MCNVLYFETFQLHTMYWTPFSILKCLWVVYEYLIQLGIFDIWNIFRFCLFLEQTNYKQTNKQTNKQTQRAMQKLFENLSDERGGGQCLCRNFKYVIILINYFMSDSLSLFATILKYCRHRSWWQIGISLIEDIFMVFNCSMEVQLIYFNGKKYTYEQRSYKKNNQ